VHNENSYERGFKSGIRPEPKLEISEWADKKRRLTSVSSAEPGPWRTSRTPYAKVPMNCLSSHSPTQEVVLMWGSQLGKTELGLNWTGYTIDADPGPMMVVQPSLDLAKRFSKQRLPTLEETPDIKKKMSPEKQRDSSNTILQKDFQGGTLILVAASSPTGLKSAPVKNLYLDEIDDENYPKQSNEGDPIDLAVARQKTFGRRKTLKTSTPTTEHESRIKPAFLKGTQEYYHVPCPQCNELQKLLWTQMRWDKTIKDPAEAAKTAFYECSVNGCVIEEYKKPYFLSEENGAQWIAENPKAGPRIRSFHLSSLYSPLGWFSWAEAVEQFLTAGTNSEKLKVFKNTYLAETWEEKGEAPEWKPLYDRRIMGLMLATVPKSVVFLTGATDVQKDRLEVKVVGWTRNKESYIVDYIVIPGDTSDLSINGPWNKLDGVIMKQYKNNIGHMMPILMMAIDSGYNTQKVYEYCRKWPRNRVIATKGNDHSKMLISQPTIVDVNLTNGKKIRRGAQVWPIGSSMAKSEIYGLLGLIKPSDEDILAKGYPSGYVHFPESLPEEYFKQLTAEDLVPEIQKGYKLYVWKKKYDRNEALDLMVMNRCAAALVGIDRFSNEQWDNMQVIPDPITKREISQTSEPASGEDVERRKPRSNWSYK